MTTYREPERVQRNQQARTAARTPRPCGDGVRGGRTCGAEPARLLPRGWRCGKHAPGGVVNAGRGVAHSVAKGAIIAVSEKGEAPERGNAAEASDHHSHYRGGG